MTRIALGVLFALGTCGFAAAQGAPRIAARDVLTISVWPAESFSKTYTVDVQGMIDFPEVGRVTAAGLTARELEDLLVKRLIDGGIMRQPSIVVDLEQKPTKRIVVAGDGINRPGEVTFAGELRIQEALLRAGSTTPDADPQAMVVRARPVGAPVDQEAEVVYVDLLELQGADVTAHNILLQDGDRVIVRRAEQIFITGNVGAPGPYPVKPGMTVEQALAVAGGVTPLGATNRISIKRKNADGEVEEIRVQLGDEVRPGDIINVPRRYL